MTTELNAEPVLIRIAVETAAAWRVEQVADTLLALDRIVGRVGLASYISEVCESYDYVIRHMGTFGLLGEAPERWKEPTSPTDLELRSDLATFISTLRNVGVQVTVTPLGVGYKFLVDDLFDLLPYSSRAEVEHLKMNSPGSWSLLSAALKSQGAFQLLEKIFDSIFYHGATRRQKAAQARAAEAQADIVEAEARKASVAADREELGLERDRNDFVLDYAVAIDSLTSSLRNAGFDNKQIQEVLRERLATDIDVLARHKSLGLVRNLTVRAIEG